MLFLNIKQTKCVACFIKVPSGAGKQRKNSALPVLLVCDWGLFISSSICLNLKHEENLGTETEGSICTACCDLESLSFAQL